MARHITTLPMRMGGLGLRSAVRTATGAYWASWADALHMVHQRSPHLIGMVVHHLSHPNAVGCLGELQESASRLDHDGFISRPSWDMLRRGVRPRPPLMVEPGEWHHGWQYYSSSNSEHHFRETVVLAQSCVADQAHLRSHSGPCASLVLHGSPSAAEFRVKPLLFRTLVLERLRLPLSITEARCVCGGCSGLSWTTQGRVPTFWPSSFTRTSNRTHTRACVPRGWRHREGERQIAGHEHQCPSSGPTGN